MRISKSTFRNAIQKLDAIEFEDCVFENCTLVYEGGPPPNLVGCKFVNSTFRFDGAARNTVDFLRGIKDPKSGLSVVFDMAFGGVASGAPAPERTVNDLETDNE